MTEFEKKTLTTEFEAQALRWSNRMTILVQRLAMTMVYDSPEQSERRRVLVRELGALATELGHYRG